MLLKYFLLVFFLKIVLYRFLFKEFVLEMFRPIPFLVAVSVDFFLL